MNQKNKIAKKDLHMPYSQENISAYLHTIKEMAKYLSTQYPNNKPAHQRNSKKGDKKKGDNLKYEDKDSNTGATAGTHVEDTTPPEKSTVPSGGASIGTNVSETNEQLSCPSRTEREILGAHLMSDDDFLGVMNSR